MTTTEDGPQLVAQKDDRGLRLASGPIEVIPWNVEFAEAIGSLAQAIDAVRGSGVPLGVADLSVLMQVMRLGPGHAVVLASMLCRVATGSQATGSQATGPQVTGPGVAGLGPSAVMPRQGSLKPRAVADSGDGPSVAGLYIPAAIREPLRLIAVRQTESGIAEAVGARSAEEELHGEVDDGGYTVYLDQHRVAKGLADNERAAMLMIGLGHGRSESDELRGDVVVLGADRHLADTDVPWGVLAAAFRVGALSERELSKRETAGSVRTR